MQTPTSMDAVEYQESTTVTLDWTLRGLQKLFDTSKGESKSKVTKSVKFGGGRWQILFYANSGTEGGGFVSLYLSCEPTAEEKEGAVNGKWVREGLYKFTFELRNTAKTVLFNQKEANDHSFSYKTANWGWAQFARRDAVYYQPASVRHQDAFLISCTITSSPSPPTVPPVITQKLVPRDLLDAVGALLDDPVYSDVEFVLPGSRTGDRRGSRRICAARKLLRRAEYFQSMFDSGFAETKIIDPEVSVSNQTSPRSSIISDIDGGSSVGAMMRHFEDSDAEDESGGTDVDDDADEDVTSLVPSTESTSYSTAQAPSTPTVASTPPSGRRSPSKFARTASPTVSIDDFENVAGADAPAGRDAGDTPSGAEDRNVRAKLSHPSSPRQVELQLEAAADSKAADSRTREEQVGPRKIRVVVRDVAYATYRAVLYYLYTDTILFAPLSSSFHCSANSFLHAAPSLQSLTQLKPQGEGQNILPGTGRGVTLPESSSATLSSRRAWIKDWELNNPGRVPPCSARAVYRLADKLGLGELKTRAFQHIMKSLTVHNVPYEMFSTFSAMFEEVRKVQLTYFLDNWSEIRNSDAMRNVWQQIRLGRHPGFEIVWPLIVSNLEFKPRGEDVGGGDGREGVGIET